MIGRKIAAVAIALSALTALPASAEEYIFGAFVGPKHGVLVYATPYLFENVKRDTNGAMSWKAVPGGQLVDARGSLAGLRTGLVDAAMLVPAFTPKNLQATTLVYAQIVLGDDVIAAGGAALETVMLHCPECLDDFRKNNAVPLAGYMTTPFNLICRDPVRTVADLKGKKVRVAAGGATLFKMADAVPVAMTPTEATTALQRGSLDCVWGAAAWLRSYGYQDVAKNVTRYPLGMHGPVMHFVMNRTRWNALSDAEKRTLIKYMPGFIARSSIEGYIKFDQNVIANAKKLGVNFIQGGSDFGKWMKDFESVDRATNLKAAKSRGVKHGEAIVDAYAAALTKWRKLSKDIGTDDDKFAAALKREIYDKLDINKL